MTIIVSLKEEYIIKNGNYLLIGEFDISKYCKSIKTTTKEVILTNEQLNHIIDRHLEVLIHLKDVKNYLANPDLIFIQNDLKDTIWIIKQLDNNIKIIIKLNSTKYGIKNYKNSIIQMQYMRNEEIVRNINTGKISKIWSNQNENIEELLKV